MKPPKVKVSTMLVICGIAITEIYSGMFFSLVRYLWSRFLG